MQYKANSPEDYIGQLPEDRQPVIAKIRKIIQEHIPKGFKEQMSYGMIGFVVPHSTYPDGYHCDPKLPLPFINLASQKTLLPYIIQASTLIQNCTNGLLKRIPSTANTN